MVAKEDFVNYYNFNFLGTTCISPRKKVPVLVLKSNKEIVNVRYVIQFLFGVGAERNMFGSAILIGIIAKSLSRQNSSSGRRCRLGNCSLKHHIFKVSTF
jgi:hypothetical protein